MNATIEQLETVKLPFVTITPVIWRDGDMCGLGEPARGADVSVGVIGR